MLLVVLAVAFPLIPILLLEGSLLTLLAEYLHYSDDSDYSIDSIDSIDSSDSIDSNDSIDSSDSSDSNDSNDSSDSSDNIALPHWANDVAPVVRVVSPAEHWVHTLFDK